MTNVEIERLLERQRPVPRPTFRGNLQRQLLETTAAPPPRRLRLLVTAYAGSGALLLAVVTVGLAGLGPLAAG